MKTLSLFAVGVLFSTLSVAQTNPAAVAANPTSVTTEKVQMKDLRHDIRVYDNSKAEAKHAINRGNLTSAQTDLAVAQTDKQNIIADKSELQSEGVKHPVKLADKQVRRADEKAVNAEITNVKADRAAEQKAVVDGNIGAAQADLADLKAARKSLKKDIREARRDGIKHPVRRAR